MIKRALQGITLAIIVSSSLLMTGCTTDQRGGRTTGRYIDDKTLNSKVRSALNDSAEYKFPDANVETFRGTVQLSGFVATAAQKSRAGEIAKSVPGVENVDNKITVK